MTMPSKYYFFASFFLLLSINLYAQSSFISYEKVKVENIASLEESFKSKAYLSKYETVASENDSIIRYGKLKKYARPENEHFGEVNVTYYYLKNDNYARKIVYTWSNPKKPKLKDFSRQFDKMVMKVSSDLNLAVGEQGKLTKVTETPVGDTPVETMQRKVIWNYGDAKIIIILIWSENHSAYLHTEIKWKR
jgi:hypothetical protein